MHQTRRLLLACLLVAVVVTLGYALAAVPNVELMTVAVFVSGFLVGPRLGATVGAVSAAIFSAFNPLGAALPPLLAAQALGQGVVGFVGGVAGPGLARRGSRWISFVAAGILGFLITVLYDVLTNIGAFVIISGDKTFGNLVKFVGAGIAFMAMHLVWNTLVFAAALTPVLIVLDRHRREISG
jgi:hypothetical protein